MRLQELYIKDYKVLQDFTLQFDEQSAVSVLIGENGSGKTTVVECLTLIFTELFRHNTVYGLLEQTGFSFEFRLRYRLYRASSFDHTFSNEFGNEYFDVEIQCDHFMNTQVRVFNEDKIYDSPELLSQFLQEEGISVRPARYLLPSKVVLYYSGISTIIEQIIDNYQKEIILDSLDGETTSTSDLFYFKPDNFPALLIGLLSFRYGNIPKQLEDNFNIAQIGSFDHIAIRLRRPKWAKSKATPEMFWGAKGDLANFLAVLRAKTTVEFGIDSVTFNIFSQHQLSEVWGFYGTEKSLFEYLVALQANGLIEQIDVFLRKAKQLIVPYQRLSEGEKQLLIMMALRELFAAENSLFLLDEPDTYLHPEWKRNFIANFQPEELLTENDLVNYLITTHSPGIVSGMRKSQLHVLQKIDGRSVPKAFSFNPYGQPEDQILFDFFEVTGLRYKPVERELDELRLLVNQGQYESERFSELFEQVEKEIGKSDEGLICLKLEITRRKRAAQAE